MEKEALSGHHERSDISPDAGQREGKIGEEKRKEHLLAHREALARTAAASAACG